MGNKHDQAMLTREICQITSTQIFYRLKVTIGLKMTLVAAAQLLVIYMVLDLQQTFWIADKLHVPEILLASSRLGI